MYLEVNRTTKEDHMKEILNKLWRTKAECERQVEHYQWQQKHFPDRKERFKKEEVKYAEILGVIKKAKEQIENIGGLNG